MKNIYKIFFFVFFALGISSCVDNENFKIVQAPDSFKIETTSGAVIVLNDANLTNTALFLSWKSTTASAGATYTIEVAKTGTDFATPTLLGTTTTTNFSMTVGELNTFLLEVMNLNAEEATSLDIRVSTGGITTQIIQVVITPFRVEFRQFFLVGSFTNWTPAEALPMTRVDFNIFEITVDLVAGAEFKFLPTNTSFDGDWGQDPNNAGTLIETGDQNLSGLNAGKYKITIDLNTFIVTVDEIIPPAKMYLVGAGVPTAGWGWDTPVVLDLVEDGVFRATTTFANDAFRFFAVNGDWGSGTNFPFYLNAGYTIDANLIDAQDGDNNFKFIGTPGEYTITLDNTNKTITLTAPGPKYMVGAGVPDAGWNWNSPIVATQISAGVWRATTSFINDTFRFFDVNGDWGSGTNFPYYLNAGYTIDANFEDALDGDNNFRFIGTPGVYTITLDSNTKTITLTTPAPKYLVGAGVPDAGWSWDSPIVLAQVNDGVWRGSTNFINDTFRFFDVNGDWGSGTNFPYYLNAGYTIDANFEDALDGDNNFRFIGTPGVYTITLDTNAKTIILTQS